MTIIKANDPLIRYTGRWSVDENCALATANGSYFEFAFRGDTAMLGFDMTGCVEAYPRLFIIVDGGARIETPTDHFIRISAEEGVHHVQVILKSSSERQERWHEPLQSRVRFTDVEAEGFEMLPPDNRPVIAFVGDSITEGISIDWNKRYMPYGVAASDMVYWGDSTAGYAWLTAKALDMRIVNMGYGCLGATKGGAGGVPWAADAYPYVCEGRPIPEIDADVVVINIGTNDYAADNDTFCAEYERLLGVIRAHNPRAKLVAMKPFYGTHASEIPVAAEAYCNKTGDTVECVDTEGWIPHEPMHPTREGTKIAAGKLAAFIRDNIL